MKATDEKKKAAVAKQTPKQRQRSLLESLGIVPGAGAAPRARRSRRRSSSGSNGASTASPRS